MGGRGAAVDGTRQAGQARPQRVLHAGRPVVRHADRHRLHRPGDGLCQRRGLPGLGLAHSVPGGRPAGPARPVHAHETGRNPGIPRLRRRSREART
ncbi:hypothetical protein G6F32_016495 [Rhizopus arrhizus]|nr:hypothetical protein G6F32_016495 [Rhizopus arrhizus]